MNSDLQQRMEAVLADALDQQEMSGASFLVMKDGKTLCRLEAGYADRKAGRKIKCDTIYRLYSMTKPITAVAAMILLERGALCLQTPVYEYIPSFSGGKVWRDGHLEEAIRPVTIHDLLNMTSGLSYGDSDTETERRTRELFCETERRLITESPMTTREFAEKAGAIPLLYQPGTSWKYGISADIMGAVIETVTNQTLGAFMRKEIFEPLGMTDTGFYVPEEKQHRLAMAYETGTDGKLKEYTGNFLGINNRMKGNAGFESGGAGLASTIDDYERFARMLLQKGSFEERQILRPGTVEYLTGGRLFGDTLSESPQGSFERWFGQRGFSYGNFMRVLWNPGQASVLGRQMEYCWDGWLGCSFVNCPRERLTFLVMQQKKDAGMLVTRLKNVLFSHDLS